MTTRAPELSTRYATRSGRLPGRGEEASLARAARTGDAQALGWDGEKVRLVASAIPVAVSLDLPVGVEETARVGDSVEDDLASEAPGPVARAREALLRLPEREWRVLVRRCGLDGGDPAGTAELGISRDMVRKARRKARRMLLANAAVLRGAAA